MGWREMKRGVGFVVLAVLLPATGQSGVIVDIEHHEGDNEPVTSGRLFLDKDLLKMVPDTDGKDEPELIYQGSKARILIVDHNRKNFMSIDAEMMQEIADRMAGMQAQMEQALSQLPPEQRQQAEAMMKQRMPAGMQGTDAAPRQLEVVALKGKKDMLGKPCQGYEVNIGGELKSRIWATEWKNVDIGPEDFAAFASMARFFEKLMQSVPMMSEQVTTELFSGLDEIDGFPILVEGFTDGVADSKTIFGEPRTQKLDAATFEPPADYKEQLMQQ